MARTSLIDFWAVLVSSPCRRDMPNLVAAYKKYKNKRFRDRWYLLDSKDAWAKGGKGPEYHMDPNSPTW